MQGTKCAREGTFLVAASCWRWLIRCRPPTTLPDTQVCSKTSWYPAQVHAGWQGVLVVPVARNNPACQPPEAQKQTSLVVHRGERCPTPRLRKRTRAGGIRFETLTEVANANYPARPWY